MYRSFERRLFILDGIRPLDFSKFDYEPSKLSPKLSQLVPKFHGEWDESAFQHLDVFYTFIEDYEVDAKDQVMTLFVKTLKDNARQAYESLPTQCISSWKEFEKWFLHEFHDASKEDDMCYERCENQSCNMEEDPNMSPLDAFFSLERFEGESSARLFLRMANIYKKIPVTIMPSRKEIMRKVKNMGISLDDPDLKLLFQILEEDDEDKEEESYDQIEQSFILGNCSGDEEDPNYISPLDAFFNLEKQEEESAVQFFLRMFNIRQEVPLECRPSASDLFNKMRELGLLYDHQFLTFLKLMNNELDAEENECKTKVPYESSEVLDVNGGDSFGQSEERSFHDDTCMTSNIGEYKNDEEDSISEEEISALLDKEYQRYIERNNLNSFSIHHGNKPAHILEVLDKDFQESDSGDELHAVYEQEEVSNISLDNETLDDPNEKSHESMPGFSMFMNPLFEEEEAKQDLSEFSIFSNPLFEDDLLCNQIHQHHDEDSSPNFEVDETHDEHSGGATFYSSSYDPGVHQTYEMESARHDEKKVLKSSSKNYPSVPSNQILGKREEEFPKYKLSSESSFEEKHHRYGTSCVKEDNQAMRICSNALVTTQVHNSRNPLFSSEHSAPTNFPEAKTKTKEYIDEAELMCIVHKEDASNAAKLKVLHEQNQVFDRGKK